MTKYRIKTTKIEQPLIKPMSILCNFLDKVFEPPKISNPKDVFVIEYQETSYAFGETTVWLTLSTDFMPTFFNTLEEAKTALLAYKAKCEEKKAKEFIKFYKNLTIEEQDKLLRHLETIISEFEINIVEDELYD